MKKLNKTKEAILNHYKKYPLMQTGDLFKFIFQSASGCEHLVDCMEKSTQCIKDEYNNYIPINNTLTDALDGFYTRVHLNYLDLGLSPQTLGKLFFKSAKKEDDRIKEIENKLTEAKELTIEGKLPFSETELENSIIEWKSKGYPPVHHSDTFRNEYKPAYRIISNVFVPFLPLFTKLDSMNGRKIVAVEGGSASGKTTLCEILKDIYNCTVIHMDDFFLPPELRTEKRYKEVGGNIDWERFLKEVIIPLKNNEHIFYRRFDCSTMSIEPAIEIIPEDLIIIEGAYSMHPEFDKYWDLSLFLDISKDFQKERILKRNSPEFAKMFFEKWIPLEEEYFLKTNIKKRCDMIIEIN